MATPGIPADIGQISSPLIIGFSLQWCLFGALTVQLVIYHLSFPNDMRWVKILVYSLYAAEVTQTIMLAIQIVGIYGPGFGNLPQMSQIYLLWFSVPILSSSISLAVQATYAYRIKLLSKSKIIPGFIVLLGIIQWGGGIATGVIAREQKDLSRFLYQGTFISLGIWNAGAALCDICIAGFMTYYLSRDKSHWKSAQTLVQRLIRLTIETGTITAALAISNLILSLLPSKPTYYQVPSALLAKTYSNTLLSVFNSRLTLGYGNTFIYESQGISAFGGGASDSNHSSSRMSVEIEAPNGTKDNKTPSDSWTPVKSIYFASSSQISSV